MEEENREYTVQDLQNNLDYLQQTKSLIKSAIIEKGQSVSSEDTFRSYADKILAIVSGGSSLTDEEYQQCLTMINNILN